MSKNAIWITGTLFAILLGLAMAYMGSDEGVMVQGLPIFAGCVALSFAVQWCAFVPAYGFSTEKFYDLAGSLTYITLVAIALSFVPESNPRDYLIGALVLIWATRLGQFLFRRVLSAGEDRRFREMKTDFLQFFMTWTLQGLWVAITLSAALAAMTASEKLPLDYWALIGWAGLVGWIWHRSGLRCSKDTISPGSRESRSIYPVRSLGLVQAS
jgi:steroid 5-alpha reductase family enzyme